MFRLEILGRATIRGQDGPLTGQTVQRQRIALLAVLAVAGERGMSRDRILGLLWPESPEDRARRSLSNALYELRRALGDNAILGSGDDLRLNPNDVASDVAEFEAAIQNGEPGRAVQLYRGAVEPFLGMGSRDAPVDVWMWGADRSAAPADVEDVNPRMVVDLYPLAESTVATAEYHREATQASLQAPETLTALASGNLVGIAKDGLEFHRVLRQPFGGLEITRIDRHGVIAQFDLDYFRCGFAGGIDGNEQKSAIQ